VVWYGLNDSSPEPKDHFEKARDIESRGINSTRGVAAEAIGAIIFADASKVDYFLPVIQSMVDDPSLAVRGCVIQSLLPLLNHQPDLAVELFLRLCDCDDTFLGTGYVERFLHYTTRHYFVQLEPLLKRMLLSANEEAVQIGSSTVVRASLVLDKAQPLAEMCLTGTTKQRLAAAEVYARHFGKPDFTSQCEPALRSLFHDPDEEVQKAAGACFGGVSPQVLNAATDFVDFYIGSPAFKHDIQLLFRLEESPNPIPNMVLSACHKFLDDETSEGQRKGMHLYKLDKLLPRLYAQQINALRPNQEVLKNCLDALDKFFAARYFNTMQSIEMFER
jgi:hypothetical protein